MSRLKELITAIERFIPGISAYKEKELLREEDLALRRYLRTMLEDALHDLRETERYAVMTSGIDPTLFEEQVVQKLEIIIRELESAEAGYAGWLDQINIEEDVLEAVLENDNALAEKVTAFREAAKQAYSDVMGGKPLDIAGLSSMVREIEGLLERRKTILRKGGD